MNGKDGANGCWEPPVGVGEDGKEFKWFKKRMDFEVKTNVTHFNFFLAEQ